MTTFVDIFCGGGTATKGLSDAGLTHVAGFDHWQPAVNNMHANGWNAEVADVTSLQSIPQADVVWASPPCTEYSAGSNHREKLEHIKELVVDAIRLAMTANPRAIVLENHPDMLKADQYKRSMTMLNGWRIQEYVIDAADIGNPSHRKRCFVIASRNEFTGPVWSPIKPQPWDAVIDIVGNGSWRNTSHAGKIAQKLANLPYCLYNYYSHPTISAPCEAAKTITCVPRSVITHKHGARRWLKSNDYRKLMGLPDDFVLTGTERDKCRIVGNGVAYVCSNSIGKFLIHNLRSK